MTAASKDRRDICRPQEHHIHKNDRTMQAKNSACTSHSNPVSFSARASLPVSTQHRIPALLPRESRRSLNPSNGNKLDPSSLSPSISLSTLHTRESLVLHYPMASDQRSALHTYITAGSIAPYSSSLGFSVVEMGYHENPAIRVSTCLVCTLM